MAATAATSGTATSGDVSNSAGTRLIAASMAPCETTLQWQTYIALPPCAHMSGRVGDARCDQSGGKRHGDRATPRQSIADADHLGADVVIAHDEPDPVDPPQAWGLPPCSFSPPLLALAILSSNVWQA